MSIQVTTTVPITATDVYRLVCDMSYLVPAIDPDVISVEKQTEGPIVVGTQWIEMIRVPLLPGAAVDVQLELTACEPGRSISFTFKSRIMSGSGTTTCTPAGSGTELSVALDAEANGIGRLIYPLAMWDFRRREKRRIATFKRLVESGQLVPADAEPAPGI